VSRGFEAEGADEGIEVIDDALVEGRGDRAEIAFCWWIRAYALTGLRRAAVSGAYTRSKSFRKMRQIEYPCGSS
jgi:hypothetical protein